MGLTLRSVVEWHVALSAAGALVAALCHIGDALSLLAGGAWALANLAMWAVIVRTLVRARQGGVIGKRARWVAGGAVVGKFALFLVVGAAILLRFPLAPLSFATGVAFLTVALLASSMLASRRALWREAEA
ncbi:hypothetical protein HRbin30_00133 [bacterium HR30]|nr:hypothetical protein HRbin30_00133 [bacterium HR30]